jgi:DNA polymerase-3 subunit epsilon
MSSDARLIDPGVDIPEEATKIHGLTAERCKAEGIDLGFAVAHIVDKVRWAKDMGVPLVGMNVAYDLTILDRLSAGDLGESLGYVIDLFVLDKQVDRYRRGSRKLSAMCQTYGVSLEDAHDSRSDVTATILAVIELARRYPALADTELPELHHFQVGWRREQVESLSDYFVGKGDPAIPVSEYSWPIYGPEEES